MGVHDDSKVYRAGPAKVYVNPTNNNDPANNYGGTLLGLVEGLEFSDGAEGVDVPATEYASSIARQWFQRSCVLSMLLRQWDADSLATFFPTSLSGSDPIVGGAARSQGQFLTAAKVLVVPAFPERIPSLVIYSADPISDPKPWRFSATSELRIAVFFVSRPLASGGAPFQMGVLSKLTI